MKSSEYFPEELIAAILCRLPVKAVLRFRCLCKLWFSLVKNPSFISTHLQISNNNTNPLFLYEFWNPENRNAQYSLRYDNEGFEECMSLGTVFDLPDGFVVAGSCKGLICLSSSGRDTIILWNPLLKKSLLLPPPASMPSMSLYNVTVGLGFVSRTQDYKVLGMFKLHYESYRAQLYSLNSNSWKDITHITPKGTIKKIDSWQDLVFVNGALHWWVSDQWWPWNSIMVFDLSNEVFDGISLPAECLRHPAFFEWPPAFTDVFPFQPFKPFQLSLKAFGESSIAVVKLQYRNPQCDIWVMKEYGVVSSWLKLATLMYQISAGTPKVLGFRSNGEALIRFNRDIITNGEKRFLHTRLASQNLNTSYVRNLMDLPGRYSFHSYVESLVLLDKETCEGFASSAGGFKLCKTSQNT